MKVELLYFDGCPNHAPLLHRLRELPERERSRVDTELVRIEDASTAVHERFLGSPTVRINGEDVEPGAAERTDFGLKCRLFATRDGLRGEPTNEWLQMAVDRASSSSAGARFPT